MSEALRIDAAQAKALVDAGRAVLVDTDPPHPPHSPAAAIAGAVRIPPSQVLDRHAELPRGCTVVAYCT
ncbi:MAG TPA: hypothetical protein VG370_20835 [Chloroflexota bacterium]|nr:hypothetical protein [Chloroflexota bacterium]